MCGGYIRLGIGGSFFSDGDSFMRFTGIFREESNDSEKYYYVNYYIRFINQLSHENIEQ